MKNILEYKGYLTKIEYSAEDKVLYVKIEGIKDLVNFESSSADEIEREFHSAVDDYLQMCEELGEAPDKAYSGTFNVRISPALHREIAMLAFKSGESLNSMVDKAIAAYINGAANHQIALLWSAYNKQAVDTDYNDYYSGYCKSSKSTLEVVSNYGIQ